MVERRCIYAVSYRLTVFVENIFTTDVSKTLSVSCTQYFRVGAIPKAADKTLSYLIIIAEMTNESSFSKLKNRNCYQNTEGIFEDSVQF